MAVSGSTGRIPALVLFAKGKVSWQQCVADTLIDGLSIDFRKLPGRFQKRLPKRLLAAPYSSLSYVNDWVDALQRSPRLRVELCNVCDVTALARVWRRFGEFPLIFVMHSANGDGLGHMFRLCERLRRRSGLLAVFVANEYNFLADKRAFIREADADFAATQLPPDAAAWLYADCGKARPLSAYASLNTRAFPPPDSDSARKVDLVFRGSAYARALGDDERTRAIVNVRDEGKRLGLRVDIDFSLVNGSTWAEMLRSSAGIPGAESGMYYLERDSGGYHRAEAYEREYPETSVEEIRRKFYAGREFPVSGKMLSSRHLEPMGTKTCQILVNGRYNDVLRPDEHYIALAKDFSNLREALEKFADVPFRERVAQAAYDLVMSEHTFEHRIEQILQDMGA